MSAQRLRLVNSKVDKGLDVVWWFVWEDPAPDMAAVSQVPAAFYLEELFMKLVSTNVNCHTQSLQYGHIGGYLGVKHWMDRFEADIFCAHS